MIAVVDTELGVFSVDLETDEVEPWDGSFAAPAAPSLSLPRVVAAAQSASTIVAVVDAKPPLLVSHDAGVTWRESGRGLPPGVAVAVGDDPDLVVYATPNRLYVSHDGAVFWNAVAVELPRIRRISVSNS
ncbi:MAG TPA: hypothetical protein VFW85_02230 [Gaiellaceae bacterium]|nr:hypothetical protein [Gaiellaceae bacterium]